jgi:5-methylcytosine-specific restriction endonuclease McrA
MAKCIYCNILLTPRHPTTRKKGSTWEGNWLPSEYKNSIYVCVDCVNRRITSENEKREICEFQNNRCSNCGKKLIPEYMGVILYDDVHGIWGNYCELDHIFEIDAGGNNEAVNKQLLCIVCHKEKTLRYMTQKRTAKEIENERRYGITW